MKFLSLVVLGCGLVLGGCAAPQDGEKFASVTEESYVPLGTNIPKKGPRSAEDKTLDMQQFDNNRTMNNGVKNL